MQEIIISLRSYRAGRKPEMSPLDLLGDAAQL